MANKKFELKPDLQVDFHYRLRDIKKFYFHEALGNTVESIDISEVDQQLAQYVSAKALRKLAKCSIRGEAVFPVPIVLLKNPFLLGYYRLLFGFSQKEFYSKGPFGEFREMEVEGTISTKKKPRIEILCQALIRTGEYFVSAIDTFSMQSLSELQLLTVGPQLRGAKNNEYGQVASQLTFNIIKSLFASKIEGATRSSLRIKNDSGRFVQIQFSSDPDIEIVELLPTRSRGLVSIEIKGGTDISNIHNRIGEAEKSHQKAKKRGYYEFMTIINVEIDYLTLKSESPTTSHFFNLVELRKGKGEEFDKFKDILSSMIGVNV